MLDTISFTIKDFRVDLDHDLWTEEPPMHKGKKLPGVVLFEFTNGTQQIGKKAYYNDSSNGFTFEIKKTNTGKTTSVTGGGHFSLPRMIKTFNVNPLTFDETKESIDFVIKKLQSIGLKFNPKHIEIKRLDKFMSINCNEPVGEYRHFIREMDIPFMQTKGDFPGGILLGNTQRQICLYNKPLEMQYHGFDTSFIPENMNLMRIEQRYLNKQSIQNKLGSSNFLDLKNKEFLENVFSYSQMALEKDLFRINKPDFNDDDDDDFLENEVNNKNAFYSASDFDNQLLTYYRQFGDDYYNQFTFDFIAKAFNDYYGAKVVKDGFRKIEELRSVKNPRQRPNAVAKSVRNGNNRFNILTKQQGRKNYSVLYDEMFEKTMNFTFEDSFRPLVNYE